jgi:hypothetical protein
MPRRLIATALVALGVGLTGCSGEDAERRTGDPVTTEEARVLAGLLARDAEAGGADVVVTAPFGEDGLLTLTGEVDLAGAAGRARAVTSYGDDRPDDVRTLFFTREEIWVGDVPGMPEVLATAGLPDVPFVRRPLAPGPDAVPLTDVVVQTVLNLGAEEPDDAAAFLGGTATWEGQRSIDSRLASVYRSEAGWSVAVDDTSDLLLQFEAPLPGQGAGSPEDAAAVGTVTVTLADHGPRTITLPAEDQSLDAGAHPEVATALGV